MILFLNLRGYSPTVWCRSCGTGVKCPDCDITLTWHRDRQEAVCHSCDYAIPAPEKCPTCNSAGVRYFGTGTQKLEEEVAAAFPKATVLRMDSDSMRKPGSHDEALGRFRAGEVDILLGTQMIAQGAGFSQRHACRRRGCRQHAEPAGYASSRTHVSTDCSGRRSHGDAVPGEVGFWCRRPVPMTLCHVCVKTRFSGIRVA